MNPKPLEPETLNPEPDIPQTLNHKHWVSDGEPMISLQRL